MNVATLMLSLSGRCGSYWLLQYEDLIAEGWDREPPHPSLARVAFGVIVCGDSRHVSSSAHASRSAYACWLASAVVIAMLR
jgi:hypothetical protein